MAGIILRRCLNGRDHVVVMYNDETQAFDFQFGLDDGEYVSWQIRERTCGQIYASDVPDWLGRREMQQNPILDGSTIYLQKLGNLLYRVTSSSSKPYAQIEQEAWEDFSATEEHTDETSYQAKDGSAIVTLSGGSGFYAMSLNHNAGPWIEPQLEFNNLSPNESLTVYYKDYLTDIEQMIQVNVTAAAPGTEPPASCTLEIVGVEPKKTSEFGGNDGEVTVHASGVENIEYSVQNGAWQTSNHFTGLNMGYVFIQARNADNTACIAKLNYYLGNEDVIDLEIAGGPNPSCFSQSNGIIYVTVGPHKVSEYSFLWSDGSTKGTRNDLAAGDYTLEITSLRSGNKEVREITVNPGIGPWDINIEIVRNNVYIDHQGQQLWYEWSDGVTDSSRENLPAGEYTLKVGGSLLNKSCYQTYYFLIDEGRHFFSDNVVPMVIQTQQAETKKNLKVIGAVYLEQEYLSENFQRIGPTNMELPPDQNGQAIFKIESILRGYLEPDLPKLTDIGIKRLDSQFKRFYMAHEEKYGEPPTIYDQTIVQRRHVLLGGLNKTEYAVDDFFDVYLPNNLPFYTWQPKNKRVYLDQPEYLTFVINQYDIDQIRLKIRMTYVNGVQQEDVLQVYESPGRYEVYRVPVGFSQLQLGSYEYTGQIQYYEIWIEDSLGIILTETRTYTLNRGTEARRYFLYLNSLGGFDTLAAIGRIASKLRVTTDEFERELSYDHPLTESEVYTLRKEGQQITNVPVGYPSKEMLKAFQDFALSEMVFMLQGERILPISIDTEPVIEDELDSLIGLEFDYSLPRDRKYTPDLSVYKPLVGEPLTVNLVSTTAVTTGGNGAIEIAVLNGTPPYSFAWSNGATSQNIDNLEPGEYSVAVTDSSTPTRYGRLNKILLTEAVLKTIEFFGENGSFEDIDTAWLIDHMLYDDRAKMEISTDVARSGTKSMKLAQYNAPGTTAAIPGDDFPEWNWENYPDEEPLVEKADLKWRLSAWIYLPSESPFQPKGYRSSNSDGLIGLDEIFGNSSYTTREFTSLASVDVRDQWQYMECIIEATDEWINNVNPSTDEMIIGFHLGYIKPTYNDPTIFEVNAGIMEVGTYFYIDDFGLAVIP